MNEWVEGWQGMGDNVGVTVVMDRACRDEAVGRTVERMHILQHMGNPQPMDLKTLMYR